MRENDLEVLYESTTVHVALVAKGNGIQRCVLIHFHHHLPFPYHA